MTYCITMSYMRQETVQNILSFLSCPQLVSASCLYEKVLHFQSQLCRSNIPFVKAVFSPSNSKSMFAKLLMPKENLLLIFEISTISEPLEKILLNEIKKNNAIKSKLITSSFGRFLVRGPFAPSNCTVGPAAQTCSILWLILSTTHGISHSPQCCKQNHYLVKSNLSDNLVQSKYCGKSTLKKGDSGIGIGWFP